MQSNLAGNQLVDRIMGAITFRTGVYDDVEADTTFTQTAWLIVIIVGFLNQLGAHRHIIGAIIGTIFVVIAFYLMCLVVGWVGREVFKATVTTDELVRTLGLAYVWQVVGVLALVLGPLGALIAFIAAILGFAASLIATKAALDLEWVQTIVTIVIGFIVLFVVIAIGGIILGILGFTAAVATGLF
jgi:hypothetical protein